MRQVIRTVNSVFGQYLVLRHTMRNGVDYDDGDTRTIRYVDGTLRGRTIDQEFQGDSDCGGWYDLD